jgi:cation transport ATPase
VWRPSVKPIPDFFAVAVFVTTYHILSGYVSLLVRTRSSQVLQQVARQIEEARALKPGIIQLVDRVLQFYLPGVLAIAGAAPLIWTLGP